METTHLFHLAAINQHTSTGPSEEPQAESFSFCQGKGAIRVAAAHITFAGRTDGKFVSRVLMNNACSQLLIRCFFFWKIMKLMGDRLSLVKLSNLSFKQGKDVWKVWLANRLMQWTYIPQRAVFGLVNADYVWGCSFVMRSRHFWFVWGIDCIEILFCKVQLEF